MTDNPYPTAAHARMRLASAAQLRTALNDSTTDDIAARLAVLELVRERGVAISARAMWHGLLGGVTVIVGSIVGIAGFFVWHNPAYTLAAAGWVLTMLWLSLAPMLGIVGGLR